MALAPFGRPKPAKAKGTASNPMPSRQRGAVHQDRETSVGREYGASKARGGSGTSSGIKTVHFPARGNDMPKSVRGGRKTV